MIRITVELVPFGSGKAEVIGKAIIYNTVDHQDRPTKGNYIYRLLRKTKKPWREGKVFDFPRQRLNVWDLLYRALDDAVGSRSRSVTYPESRMELQRKIIALETEIAQLKGEAA